MPSSVLAQPVSGTANGFQRGDAEGPVDLVAQVADVDVDDVGAGLVGGVPAAFQQLGAGVDDAGTADQGFQQGEFLVTEPDFGVGTPDSVFARVQA